MIVSTVRCTPEAFVKANDLRLCYQTFGEPAHPPLVLITGMGAQMILWDDGFCELLAAQGFWVLRFDHRDVGRSTRFDSAGVPHVPTALTLAWLRRPVPSPYLLHDMALDIVGLLDSLKISSAHVVGTSMGGTIGQMLAIHHPERVLSLTSIMSTTGHPDLPQPRSSVLATVFSPAPQSLDAYIAHYVTLWRVLRVSALAEEEELDRLRAVRNYERGLNPAGTARHLTAILASGSRREALRGVSVPTLVIHGDVDPLVPLAGGVDTAASIPGAKLIVLEGMGHALPLRLWQRIVEEVTRHASQVADHGRRSP
jgi:pimeloyl-ACP methyl ester carboxylesterase